MSAIVKLCKVLTNNNKKRHSKLLDDYYNEINKEYSPKLISIAIRKVQNQDDAEDIVQNIVIKSFEELRIKSNEQDDADDIVQETVIKSFEDLNKSIWIEFNENAITIFQSNPLIIKFLDLLENSNLVFNKTEFKDWITTLDKKIKESYLFIRKCADDDKTYINAEAKTLLSNEEAWSKKAEKLNRDGMSHRDLGKALLAQLERISGSLNKPDSVFNELITSFEQLISVAAAIKISVPCFLFHSLEQRIIDFYKTEGKRKQTHESIDKSITTDSGEKDRYQTYKDPTGKIIAIRNGHDNHQDVFREESLTLKFEDLDFGTKQFDQETIDKLLGLLKKPVLKAEAELLAAKNATEKKVGEEKLKRQQKLYQLIIEYLYIDVGLRVINNKSDSKRPSNEKIADYLNNMFGQEFSITIDIVRGLEDRLAKYLAQL